MKLTNSIPTLVLGCLLSCAAHAGEYVLFFNHLALSKKEPAWCLQGHRETSDCLEFENQRWLQDAPTVTLGRGDSLFVRIVEAQTLFYTYTLETKVTEKELELTGLGKEIAGLLADVAVPKLAVETAVRAAVAPPPRTDAEEVQKALQALLDITARVEAYKKQNRYLELLKVWDRAGIQAAKDKISKTPRDYLTDAAKAVEEKFQIIQTKGTTEQKVMATNLADSLKAALGEVEQRLDSVRNAPSTFAFKDGGRVKYDRLGQEATIKITPNLEYKGHASRDASSQAATFSVKPSRIFDYSVDPGVAYLTVDRKKFDVVLNDDKEFEIQEKSEDIAFDVAAILSARPVAWNRTDDFGLAFNLGVSGLSEDPGVLAGATLSLVNQQLHLGIGWSFIWVDQLADGQFNGKVLASEDDLKLEKKVDGGVYFMVSLKGFNLRD